MVEQAAATQPFGFATLSLAAMLIGGCIPPQDAPADTIGTTTAPSATSLVPVSATALLEPGATQPGPGSTSTKTSDAFGSNGSTPIGSIEADADPPSYHTVPGMGA